MKVPWGTKITANIYCCCCYFSVANTRSPHGQQPDRFICAPLSPGVGSDSCPLSQWCYINISSFVTTSFLAFRLCQHQGLLQRVGLSHKVAKILELELEHKPFQWIFRVDFPWDWLAWSPSCPKDSQFFSSTTIWKHHFLGTQASLWSNSHISTWLLDKP